MDYWGRPILRRPHYTEPREPVNSIGRLIPCDYCGRNNLTNGSPKTCCGCGAPVQDYAPPRRTPPMGPDNLVVR